MYQLHVMLDEKHYTHLKEQQRRSGLSTSALIRSLLDGLEIKERPTEAILQVYRELNAIGHNINQLTRAANQGVSINTDQLAAIQKELERLWYWAMFDSEPPEPCKKRQTKQQGSMA